MHFLRTLKIGLNQKSNRRKQFMPNLISNGVIFILNIFLGMWFTPYLIKHLGVDVYGLVPLTNNVVVYLSLISLSLNGAVGRYLTIDLENEDYKVANKTFNTAFWGNIGLSILTLPIVILIVWLTPIIFDVPEGYERATQILFFFAMITYLISMVRNSFSVSSWTRNRFDLRNIVIGFYQTARVGFVVVLFSFFIPRLEFVGIGLIGAAFIGLGGDILVWQKLTPQLKINFSNFDLGRLKQLFGMGGWLVVNQVGSLLFLHVDLIVVNIILGALDGGKYGAILLFSTMLRNLGQTISSVIAPTIVAKYANGKIESVERISTLSVKYLGLFLALPVGLIAGFARPLLGVWLGPDFENLSWLLVILISHLTINLSVLPLFSINIAYNKVKWPGIVTLGSGVINLLLSLLFASYFGWGMVGVAAAGAIVLTLKNALFTPIYAAGIQGKHWFSYLKYFFPSIIITFLIFSSSYILSNFFEINSWSGLLFYSLPIFIIFIIFLFLIIKPSERIYLLGLLPNGKNK